MRRLIDRAWLIAIDPHARYPVARGTVGNPFTRGALGVARVLGVLIVLADEDHRQLPHRCKVQRFMECADVRSAITEVGDRHARFAAQLRGQRKTAGDRHARADDRSEEHTSELQSLMRISYAVFCLKKKIKQQKKT